VRELAIFPARADLDAQIAAIVYAVARNTNMPAPATQDMRNAARDLARRQDYTEQRALRNGILTAGRYFETRVEASKAAIEKRWDNIRRSLDIFGRFGVGFASALTQEVTPLSRPVGADVLVNRLVAVSLEARSRPTQERMAINKAAASIGIDTGSGRYIEGISNVSRALKVGSFVAYAVSQASLDNRFADRPDRPPTADEVRQAIQHAEVGRQAAELNFEERRKADARETDVFGEELAQAPQAQAGQKTRQRTKEVPRILSMSLQRDATIRRA
jgi:hypothetical protein